MNTQLRPCLDSRGASLARSVLAMLSVLTLGSLARATTLYWDGGDATANTTYGGTGTWDAGITADWTNTDTITEQAWTDTIGTDTAYFTGTAANVTVDGTVTVGELQFNVSNNTISGGAIDLAGSSYSTSAPAIAIGTTSNTTINSALSGNNLVITGGSASTASITLKGDNSGLTGNLTLISTVNEGTTTGTLAIGVSPTAAVSGSTNNPLGNATLVFAGNTTQITIRDSTGGNYGNDLVIDGGNGIINVGNASGGGNATLNPIVLGNLTYSTAGTLSIVGQPTAKNFAIGNVILNAAGTFQFIAVGGVATIGGISDPSATGSSFTLAASTTTVTGTTLIVNGASSYTGATNITSGTFRTAVAGALPTATIVTLGKTGYSATLDLYGTNQTIAGLTLASGSTAGSQTVTNSATGASTLTINGATDTTFGGVIKDGGTGKTVALTQAGSSTFTLTGANTYTGATTVNGGTLAIGAGGSLASASYVIGSGGTFDTSALASYDLSGVATTIGVGASTSGLFKAQSLTLGGTLTLNFSTASLASSYTLLSSSSLTGDFSSVTLTGALTGSLALTGTNIWTGSDIGGYDFSLNEATGILTVTTSAIPEPATWALFLGAISLATAAGTRRLRRRA